MKKPWEADNCEAVSSYYSYYTVPQAALLWCGVPPDHVEQELALATPASLLSEHGKSILKHPYIKCLEPRCRVLQDAIDKGKLAAGRDGGTPTLVTTVRGHIAYSRRTLNREHLKAWIASEFPSEKPSFLFDEIERTTHTAINADSFRALTADRDAVRAQLDRSRKLEGEIKAERDALRGERDSLRAIVDKMDVPGERAEGTYLNIIGALLELVLGKTTAGKPHSVFQSQAAIIDALVAHHEGKPGISKPTLENKFAEARRRLKST